MYCSVKRLDDSTMRVVQGFLYDSLDVIMETNPWQISVIESRLEFTYREREVLHGTHLLLSERNLWKNLEKY